MFIINVMMNKLKKQEGDFMKKHTTSSIFSSMDLSHLPEVDIVRIMQEQIHIFYILVLRALSSWVQVVEMDLEVKHR